VKIAIVALPPLADSTAAPPLPLGYIAAWMEQQRHIVRIYDHMLAREVPIEQYIETMRAFRPNLVIVASEDRMAAAHVHRMFANLDTTWMHIHHCLRGPTPAIAAEEALKTIDAAALTIDQRVMLLGLQALTNNIDNLPVPARHMLPIERYQLRSPSGALQTNVLIGQIVAGQALLRNPRTIVAELRSVVHENGIWHILFEGLDITNDPAWMHDFLYGLMMERLGVSWEAAAQLDALSPDLVKLCRRAGCEGLIVSFDAMQALDSQQLRAQLAENVRVARAHNLRMRGFLTLESTYRSIPDLVDIAATFELDDVTFHIRDVTPANQDALRPTLANAQHRYRSLQNRQYFVERYGAWFGALIWRMSRINLLARGWHRLAGGKA
jgi:hypothetical protein